ncbi:MAG: xanthine dehydrogenase family protein molybdopterin-binding subunit [Planctomycetota bacterium]
MACGGETDGNSSLAASQPGSSWPRIDGVAKVTGAARYVDDYQVPRCLHGVTLRSEVAHGVFLELERDAAFDWSRVTVVTAADIPGRNVIALIEDDQVALVPVGGAIRHHDEALALVAAPTRELAAEALRRLRPRVRELPAALDVDAALAGTPLIFGSDNIMKRLALARGGDVEAELRRCDLVIDSVYETGAQEQMYIEPQGMLCDWRDDRCELLGSMQCPYFVHRALCELLALPAERVVVTQAVTGGGFGGKEEYPSMIAAHAALLARKARAPVKLIYERSEDIGATTKRHPARIRHRMGVTRDGRVRAVDIDILLDGGAYVTLSPVVLSRALLHAAGPYRIEHVRVTGRVVATNFPPHGAFRGFGAPQVTFAYERQMQKAARRLGIEPFELRRRNMLRVGDETATGQRLTSSVGSGAVLAAVEERARRPAPHAPLPRSPLRRRGRGLAFCLHGAGFTGSGESRLRGQATVAITPRGNFEIRSSSTDIGQGALTVFAQLAAASLGVEIGSIELVDPSTARVPDSGPTVASRTCMVVGGLVARAAEKLRAQLEAYAQRAGLANKTLHEIALHHAQHVGDGAITETYAPPPGVVWDDATYTGAAYPVYGWAACLVDVEVDPDTYEVEVVRCIHAVDVGKAIHPVIVEGQIEGGTLQALGWALWESVAYDAGRVVNRRMTDCIIPTAIEAPEMETIIVEEPYPLGPFGAKGVGEISMDGPAVAVAGAIVDALDIEIDQLPVLPEHIAALLDERVRAGERLT